MMATTLTKIRAHGPCEDGWRKLLAHLGKTRADDEPLPFSVILESNGIDDALWCTRAAPEYDREWRLFAVWCARQVQHMMKDERSIVALDVAERHAKGEATDDELRAASAAGSAAVDADPCDYATASASTASVAAGAASAAAEAAAAAFAAAWYAAGAAGNAAWDDARDAAWYDAWDAWDDAWDAARKEQAQRFLEIVGESV